MPERVAEQEAVRLNKLAATLVEVWGQWLPLSVRYGAARAADAVVAEWFKLEAK